MSDSERRDEAGLPSPADLARPAGVKPSDGPSGDASIDALLTDLSVEVDHFAQGTDENAGDAVVECATSLHARLQERLDEAAG